MSVAFSFDPVTPEIQATFPTTIGDEYSLFSNAPFANWSDDIVATNPFTAVVTGSDVGTLHTDSHYAVGVINWNTHEVLAVAMFQQGTSDEFTFPVTWTYDGSGNVTVTFTAPSGFVGENWLLQANAYDFSNLGTAFILTTGSSQTGSLTFTPPASGDLIFTLSRTTEKDWAVARATVGSTTVDKGSYTWNVVAAGFTLTAGTPSITFTSPSTETIEIDVGLVDSAETVDLTIDDSSLPFGVTASLDVTTGTTPYNAILTLVATSGAECASGSVTIQGTDGTNTHSVTIPVITSGTNDTYDETGPGASAQIGSDMSQTGEHIVNGAMCIYKNELYWGWTENFDGASSYLAKWNGSDWDVVAGEAIFGITLVDGGPIEAKVRLATDGDNLYFAFEREYFALIHNCHSLDPDATELISPYKAECWKFDGSAWELLGSVASGQVVNDGDPSLTSTTLELSASSDEPGAAYIAYFEEGFEGNSETTRWFSRHLSIAGFGTSTLGVVVLDGELYQMPRPVDELGQCIAPDGAGAHGFPMRLVGSGASLALYSQAYGYDQFLAPYWSKINVWQPSGITEVDLATDFPHDDLSGTFIGYDPPLVVSENDIDGKRWVSVGAITSFSSHLSIIRETTQDAPTVFDYTFGIADRSADDVGFRFDRLIGEPGQLWSVDQVTSGGTSTGQVELLTDRCGLFYWGNTAFINFSSGVAFGGNPVIFEDALWMSGGAGHTGVKAHRVPICRECGTCCGLVTGCPPSIFMFYRDGQWRRQNVDTEHSLWIYKDGQWVQNCEELKGRLEEAWLP